MTNLPAGCSGTPLWKKLGFKPGMRAAVLNATAHYAAVVRYHGMPDL